MGIDMMVDHDKLQFDKAQVVHSRSSKVYGSLLVVMIICLLAWGGMTLSHPDTLPIKQVRIEGDFTRLSPVDLQLLVTDKVRGGFFNLNVDAVKLALVEEPWVSHVTVKRIWPDALRVIVIEQTPAVRWRDEGLLNTSGEYFEPEPKTIPPNLPLLSGPDGMEVMLLEQYESMQTQVQTIGFSIASITLDDRRAWSFVLTNGIKVILGRHDFDQRFNRFLTLIPASLSGRVDQTDLIDMRYTNGFSIRWKK
ncbi:MAG: cell division protein FtsQ/DivIB [Proteobacteria bacterium]|nr:cell division protein FtsQ/DivIB [Pseudomonadota bacterium]